MEALAKQLSQRSQSILFMVVGGSFDMISGNVKRAPKIIRTIGFEWLWRLAEEPWRWQRQTALLKFIVLVIVKNIQTFIFQVP